MGNNPTEQLVALFRKAVIFQDRNRLELVFETEEEADAAGDFIHGLGDDLPAPSVSLKFCTACEGYPKDENNPCAVCGMSTPPPLY
jgi:hypothetical protein